MTAPSRLASLLLLTLLSFARAAELPLMVPTLADERLQVTLYASDPEIVTPIGAAVDARGRLFVLESHTHLRPTTYSGPKLDRIKIFEGVRADGRAERVSIFADDVEEGMNLAFAPDGTLHVCAAKSVYSLPDRDHDGRADGRRVLLTLDTAQRYPHSQLLGLTIGVDGWLYASRGNVGGLPYAWVGADGTRLPGYGDGGDIVRCRLDGTKLERVATGFWNPFDLKFDRFGRLLAVDNDPDSRGPNRLLHVTPGGDYGYKSLYGPSGLHPYQAWEGDLPGTLPLIVGVGESPSGLLDCTLAAFPAGYRDKVLVTVWGAHTITAHKLERAGSSLRGTSEPFMQGGEHFRPVALAAAPDGAVYLTDWVLSGYPNHGRGRIWRITAKAGTRRVKPRAEFAAPEREPALARLEKLQSADTPATFAALHGALTDNDPFVRSAAVAELARPVFREAVERDLEHADARVRLGALLALRRADISAPARVIAPRLADPDPQVRRMALVWTGEKVLKPLVGQVDRALGVGELNARLFETWLATMQILQSDADAHYAKQTPGSRIKRTIEPAFIDQLIRDSRRPAAVRAFALPRLTNLDTPENHALLVELALEPTPAIQVEAIARLGSSSTPDTPPLLRRIALDRAQPSSVRAEALVALAAHVDISLAALLDDPDPAVRIQTARTLRFTSPSREVKAAAERALARVSTDSAQRAFARELGFLLGRPDPQRPTTVESWQQLLAEGGDREAGRRVFHSPTTVCVQCHRLGARGGMLGPDLSVIGRTDNRAQLIRSIEQPSADIAPQFQGWEVRAKNGEVITGLQGHIRTGKGVSIIPLDGKETFFAEQDVAHFGALPGSLMPEGLEGLLSVEEFRDLVAFLEGLK